MEASRPAAGAEADDRAQLLALPAAAFAPYWIATGKTNEYKLQAVAQAEGILSGFFNPVNSVFYRRLDHEAACAVLEWVHELYRFLEKTTEWRYGKKHYELLKAIFQYFISPFSPYVSMDQGGLMVCRMKKEYPFLRENSVFNILPLNVLWYQVLNIMNQLGQRYADIKMATVTEGMIRKFQQSFHAGFWDEQKGVLKFAWHRDSDYSIVSGEGLCALQYTFDDLLYKQKKKRFLREIWEVYYNDKGVKETARDNESLRPDYLPVYWRAFLKLNEYSPAKKKEVEGLLDAHIAAGRPVEIQRNNPLYQMRLLEFLTELRS